MYLSFSVIYRCAMIFLMFEHLDSLLFLFIIKLQNLYLQAYIFVWTLDKVKFLQVELTMSLVINFFKGCNIQSQIDF